MSDKELEIFILCEKLAELLGNGEAIADLRKLYNHHPEMFKDMQEVSKVINEVVQEPDLIMKNTKPKSEKDFIVAKQILEINNKKMGDIGIRSNKDINIIYHANKQDKRNFNRFLNKVVPGEAVRSLHTPSQNAQMGGDDKSSGANALSETTDTIIPQSPNNDEETYMIPNQNTSNTHFITQDSTSNLSLEEQISLAKENQKTLNAMPKASDIDKDNTQESTQTQDTTQRVETQSQNSIRNNK